MLLPAWQYSQRKLREKLPPKSPGSSKSGAGADMLQGNGNSMLFMRGRHN